jgi:hypothetical protein
MWSRMRVFYTSSSDWTPALRSAKFTGSAPTLVDAESTGPPCTAGASACCTTAGAASMAPRTQANQAPSGGGPRRDLQKNT